MDYGLTQIQCQNLCLDDAGSEPCTGIVYSYGDEGYQTDDSCQLCHDDGEDWSNGAFVFYRRPGNRTFYSFI